MHDEWTDRLSEYLDGELDAAERDRLDRHLAGCAECAATLTALRSVVAAARSLPDREPPVTQWAAIAARIEEESVAALRPRRRFVFTLTQLAAASLALMLASGGAVWVATRPGPEPPAATATSPAAPAGTLVSFDARAYQTTIADLEAALRETRDRLAPETLAAVERSLAAIDTAIAEAIAALRDDPNDPFLVRYLERTMVRKIDILKRATPRAPART